MRFEVKREVDEDILIADAPEEFAAAIKELLSDADKARRLADDCKRLVLRDYSLDAAEREARTILEHVRTATGV